MGTPADAVLSGMLAALPLSGMSGVSLVNLVPQHRWSYHPDGCSSLKGRHGLKSFLLAL
jgi:hypothetical protein